MTGIIRSPKRAKSERVVELVIGNMSGWILQDVGSVARPWEHPLFWGGVGPPLLPPWPPIPVFDDRGSGGSRNQIEFHTRRDSHPVYCPQPRASGYRFASLILVSVRLFVSDPDHPSRSTPIKHSLYQFHLSLDTLIQPSKYFVIVLDFVQFIS